MDYYVLIASGLEELESLVREFIGSGWEPQGGVCARGHEFLQAMVRKPRGNR